MNVIIISEDLAIPVRNIDYVKLSNDERELIIETFTKRHYVQFNTADKAIELFDVLVEAMEKIK